MRGLTVLETIGKHHEEVISHKEQGWLRIEKINTDQKQRIFSRQPFHAIKTWHGSHLSDCYIVVKLCNLQNKRNFFACALPLTRSCLPFQDVAWLRSQRLL